jgi:hypothetical protein
MGRKGRFPERFLQRLGLGGSFQVALDPLLSQLCLIRGIELSAHLT